MRGALFEAAQRSDTDRNLDLTTTSYTFCTGFWYEILVYSVERY